jgi:hypothetical protein
MRGSDERSGSLFPYVDLEAMVRRDHPLRPIRQIANAALAELSEDFAALYPPRLGRPSIPPARLLRAMLLQAFYGIRSERQLMERMEFYLLFRWFVGLGWTTWPGTIRGFRPVLGRAQQKGRGVDAPLHYDAVAAFTRCSVDRACPSALATLCRPVRDASTARRQSLPARWRECRAEHSPPPSR